MSSPEEIVRRKLSRQLGISLEKKKLPIGHRLNGEQVRKEFDIVSSNDEGNLVGEIKCYKFGNNTTGQSGYITTRVPRLLMACFYLKRVRARRKMLVLTDKELYEQFTGDMEGLLHKSIEIRFVKI